jgi:hypothetical protein
VLPVLPSVTSVLAVGMVCDLLSIGVKMRGIGASLTPVYFLTSQLQGAVGGQSPAPESYFYGISSDFSLLVSHIGISHSFAAIVLTKLE